MKDVFDSPVIPLALLVCDTVISDAATGKKTLVGIFNSIASTSYPHGLREFFVFVSLTNCDLDTDIAVRLANSDGGEIFNLKGVIHCKSRHETPEVVFNIRNLVIPAEGAYKLTLVANGIPVSERTIIFAKIVPKDAKQ